MTYFSEFKDLDQNTIRVEIITNDGGEPSEPVELYIQADGLNITYNGDGLYKPIIKSMCSITFVVEDVIPDFYTGELLSPEVYVYKNGDLFWFGYIEPNVYNQPYNLHYEALTINCIDTLAQANNVDYTYITNEVHEATFLSIIEHILNRVDPDSHIQTIFCTTALQYDHDSDILSQLSIIERNFKDELSEPMKGDECIEEICKYLGLTMFQYKDAYYIVDYNKLDAGFTSHDRGGSATNALSSTARNVNTIGVTSSDCSISFEGIYNKVTVVASTLKIDNPIDSDNQDSENSLFGDLSENTDSSSQYYDNRGYEKIDLYTNPSPPDNFSVQNWIIDNNVKVGQQNVWQLTSEDGWNHYIMLHKWKESNNWDHLVPQINDYPHYGSMSYNTAMGTNSSGGFNYLNWSRGTTWQQSVSYKEGEAPSTLDWKNYFTMSCIDRAGDTQMQNELEKFCLSYESQGLSYKGGAFIINLKYYISATNTFACLDIPEFSDQFDDSSGISANSFKKQKNIKFPATLSLGNNYWDGNSWQTYSNTHLLKITNGYFNYGLCSMNVEGDWTCVDRAGNVGDEFPWLRYINKKWNATFNDWEYVSNTEYENHIGDPDYVRTEQPVKTGTGGQIFLDGPMVVWWIKDANGVNIQVSKDYRDQYVVDKFWLGKKFNNGEKMYGTEYTLDNMVTYESQLTNPSSGIMIKIPADTTLTGDFKFSIGRPMSGYDTVTSETYTFISPQFVVHISDLYVRYSTEGEVTSSNNDIIYSNVINSGYVNSLDDITMKVNTYTTEIASYSYVLHNHDFIEEITYGNSTQKQEQNIINKLVGHYSSAKYIYENTLHNSDITPASLITDSSLHRTMPVVGVDYNMYNNYARVTCIEV